MAITYLSGERIQGLAPAPTSTHSQSHYNTLTGIDLNQPTGGGGWGIKIVSGHTLVGKKMNSITFNMRIANAQNYATQTITLKHFGSAPATIRATGSTMSSDDVHTSTSTDYTFTFANPVTIQADDFILMTVPDDLGTAGGWYATISESGEESGSYVATWTENSSSFGIQTGQSRKMTYSAVYQSGDGDVKPTDVPDGTRYEETNTCKIFHKRTQTGSGGGDIWLEKGNTFSASALRGFASAGSTSSGATNTIDYVTIQTLGDATDFGDLITAREGSGSCADATRCLDGASASIEYWTAATLSGADDFGDLFSSRTIQNGAFADSTRGVFAGGSNVIDWVTIQSAGTASDFGDLRGAYQQTSGCADATRGIIAGGYTGSNVDAIDHITIQTAANAGEFGNLDSGKYALAATSDATRGLIMGGQTNKDEIQFITIQTTGNSQDFGNLTVGREKLTAYADSTRGCSVGGANGGRSNVIDYVTIQTLGNADNFGDLTQQKEVTAGCSA